LTTVTPMKRKAGGHFGGGAKGAIAEPPQKVGADGRKLGPDRSDDPQQATNPNQTKRPSREDFTAGIKHFVPNKIRLAGQKEYLDNNPCLLIVPVMDLDTMKGWNGGGYKAIVLAGTAGEKDSMADICATTRMLKVGPIAAPHEVETARALLANVVRAMAHSLEHRFSPTSRVELRLTFLQEQELARLRKDLPNRFGGGVLVPRAAVVHQRVGWGRPPPRRVRMVEFASIASSSEGHPAPDPLLLAVRAAVNWSARHNQRLLAAAEPQDDDGDDDGDSDADLDRLAEEEFLEWRETEQEREREEWRDPT
jgi:hypothetical protein